MMTRGTFILALNGIDERFVAESLQYSVGKTKKERTVIRIAALIACLAVVLIGALSIILKSVNDQTISTQESNLGEELTFTPVSKPTTGHKIGVKCRSLYSGKTITFDAFMSQLLTESEKTEIDGYPVFEVFQETDGENGTEERWIVINGHEKNYEKRFSLEDLDFLVAPSSESDVFDGHSERVVLDFRNLEPGDTVTLVVSYGFFYYSNNPYNQTQPDDSWCGKRIWLYCSCKENGISVSANSLEDAESILNSKN